MKMIDDKGMLFGKINIIDFLVILFLFCLMPMLYFGYKIFTKKPEIQTSKSEFIEIEIDCLAVKIKPEVLKVISIGDRELDNNGQVIGEVVNFGEVQPYKYELDIGRGQKIIKEDETLKQVKAKLKLKVGVQNENVFYKDKEIKAVLPFEFNTDKYRLLLYPLIGETRKTAEEEAETVPVVLRVKCSNLLPELARIIKPGDKEMELVKANIRKIVARIIEVISNEPSEVVSLLEGGRWSITGHPKYRDVVLNIEILCAHRVEGLFKRDEPIKIGGFFTFSTDLYSIKGTITGLEIK
ncbi:MAG: DUF4330 domain-containing protein [Candidatus Omnitrophota bacterium]|nr:MAG: DUF4330 domain-containing protein [Candidatus Omnitrophota bacterium]